MQWSVFPLPESLLKNMLLTDNGGLKMRTVDEVIDALRNDESWELSPEDREFILWELPWTLIDF